MVQATQLSFLGVALDKYRSVLAAGVAASATSITVQNATGWASTGFVTIYDPTSAGGTTETKAYSAVAGNVITCSALTNAHLAGCLVVVTAAADAPTTYIPIRTMGPFDNLTLLGDTNYRGAMVDEYNKVKGVIHGEYDVEGDIFADTTPWFFGALLGDYVKSGASAPYTHVFAQQNTVGTYGGGQPESITITDFDSLTAAGGARAFPGMVVDSLDITFSADALLTYKATLKGWPSGIVAKPTTSFSTLVPTAVWTGGTTIGGSNILNLQSGNITLTRNASVLNTVSGVQTPYSVWLGPTKASGKLTFIADDETYLLNYLNVTTQVVAINFTTGTGAALTQVLINASKCFFENTKVMRGGDYVTVETDFTAEANTTDVGASGGYSPVKITVQNAVSTAQYQ